MYLASLRPEPRLGLTSSWLPAGTRAAVCFTIDDIHPASFTDPYEAGGALERGALGRVLGLLERHARLRVTLFTTPDWRALELTPQRRVLARIPWLRDRVQLAPRHAAGTFRLDRFPEFVDFLNRMPRTEVALHGLHHTHRGRRLAVEFQRQSRARCLAMIDRAVAIFERSGLRWVRGFSPPGWNLPDALKRALDERNFHFVASARDLKSPITSGVQAKMSGLTGVPLLHPHRLTEQGLVHLSANFQATSSLDRAHRIIEAGGLLSVKAHIFKQGGGHHQLDGLDDAYCDHLDLLFERLESCYGRALWWTSMDEVAQRVRAPEPC